MCADEPKGLKEIEKIKNYPSRIYMLENKEWKVINFIINEKSEVIDFSSYVKNPTHSPLRFEVKLSDDRPFPEGLNFDNQGMMSGIPAQGTAGPYVLVITVFNDLTRPLKFSIPLWIMTDAEFKAEVEADDRQMEAFAEKFDLKELYRLDRRKAKAKEKGLPEIEPIKDFPDIAMIENQKYQGIDFSSYVKNPTDRPLRFELKLWDGSPLPAWLTYDRHGILSGIPVSGTANQEPYCVLIMVSNDLTCPFSTVIDMWIMTEEDVATRKSEGADIYFSKDTQWLY